MRIAFSIVLFVTISFSSCTNKEREQTITYNDTIVAEVDKADSVIRFLFNFDMFDRFPQIEKDFNYTLNAVRTNLEKLTPVKNDDSLRLSALQLIDTYSSILNDDYAGIYAVMKDSTYTAADSLHVDSLMNEMYIKWQIEGEHMARLQKRFAERHGIELEI